LYLVVKKGGWKILGKAHPFPTLEYEKRQWLARYGCVAGLDEAGRGAWAGPVVAAAVILPPHRLDLLQKLADVRDSKTVSAARREILLDVICESALTWGVGAASPGEIDRLGIVPATRTAMMRALETLSPPADYLLIDHLTLPQVRLPQHSLPKGDARVLSIAAASIVAKVSRDRMMIELEAQIPGYGFARHKGYGTAAHRAALTELGPSQIHRLSFAPVRTVQLQHQERSAPGSLK
jgi:ribonuclease HII